MQEENAYNTYSGEFMKFIKLIFNFFKGSVIASIVIMLMMSVSLFLTSYVTAKINYISYDYNFLEECDTKNLYSSMNFPIRNEDGTFTFLESNEVKNDFKNSDCVESIYNFPTSSTGIIINFPTALQTNIQIIFVDSSFIKTFSGFSEMDIDLSLLEKSENSCIIMSESLSDAYSVGDTISIQSNTSTENINLQVVDACKSPFKFFNLSNSTNAKYSLSQIFHPLISADKKYVIMKESEENLSRFSNCSNSANFIIKFKSGANRDDIQKTLVLLEEKGALLTSFDEIKANTKGEMNNELKTSLPFPLFLLFVSLVSYISMLILIFKKKEKDFAVYHILGASKLKITLIYLIWSFIIVLPSLIINLFFSIVFPTIQKIAATNSGEFPNLYVNGLSYLIIFSYLALTLVIASAITFLSMKKYSPLEFLRGVSV